MKKNIQTNVSIINEVNGVPVILFQLKEFGVYQTKGDLTNVSLKGTLFIST